jgi:hypothetical protein
LVGTNNPWAKRETWRLLAVPAYSRSAGLIS